MKEIWVIRHKDTKDLYYANGGIESGGMPSTKNSFKNKWMNHRALLFETYEELEKAIRTYSYYIKELGNTSNRLRFSIALQDLLENGEMLQFNVDTLAVNITPISDIATLITLKEL